MKLEKNIDKENDSIRLYIIGNNYENKVIHLGKDKEININSTLIF